MDASFPLLSLLQYEVKQCSLDVPDVLPTEVDSAQGLPPQGQGEVPSEQQTEAMEVCEGQTGAADGPAGGTDGPAGGTDRASPTAAGERAANGRKGSLKVVRQPM